MSLQVSSLTKEYVKVPVRGFTAGEAQDLSGYTVQLAFVDEDEEPEAADWVTASWEEWPDDFYFARCLIGPGGDKELTNGTYDTWINIVAGDEDLKRFVDRLVVT